MKSHRESLIETAVSDSELPPEFATQLLDSARWLDGTEAVSEELGSELLADEALPFDISRRKLVEFLERYNTLVQGSDAPKVARQAEAYVAIGTVLAPLGKADAFGEGDYWLVSDSFSTRSPTLLVYGDFRLSSQDIATLQDLLNQYNAVFSEFRINTEYGAEVVTLYPQ